MNNELGRLYCNCKPTINFLGNAGESQTFVVSPINDNILENDETVVVSMSDLSTQCPLIFLIKHLLPF